MYFELEELTNRNNDFRRVIFTGKFMQLVLMSLKPGEEIGEEIHDHVDQFFRIEDGEALLIIDDQEIVLKEDSAAIVPAGSKHNLKNTGSTDLKLYTIYSPPNHPEDTVHSSMQEAIEADEGHH